MKILTNQNKRKYWYNAKWNKLIERNIPPRIFIAYIMIQYIRRDNV